jgi:hypothetical protein
MQHAHGGEGAGEGAGDEGGSARAMPGRARARAMGARR